MVFIEYGIIVYEEAMSEGILRIHSIHWLNSEQPLQEVQS